MCKIIFLSSSYFQEIDEICIERWEFSFYCWCCWPWSVQWLLSDMKIFRKNILFGCQGIFDLHLLDFWIFHENQNRGIRMRWERTQIPPWRIYCILMLHHMFDPMQIMHLDTNLVLFSLMSNVNIDAIWKWERNYNKFVQSEEDKISKLGSLLWMAQYYLVLLVHHTTY